MATKITPLQSAIDSAQRVGFRKIHHDGFTFAGITYRTPDLIPFDGNSFFIRIDESNLSLAYVFDLNGTLIATAERVTTIYGGAN